MKSLTLKSVSDIPDSWERFTARKKTKVKIRSCHPGGESFIVPWSSSKLHANPDEDLVVVPENGDEYPCKKDIFFDTYQALPSVIENRLLGGYSFVKKATSQLVKIPEGYTLDIHSLEGIVYGVKYPDYIVIGAKEELYANTKNNVEDNMEIL